MTDQQRPNTAVARERREALSLAGLLVLSAIVRLPFWKDASGLTTDERGNLACASGSQYVVTSPGYIGYCFAGRLLKPLFSDGVSHFVFLSFACTLGSIALCHFLARSLGCSPKRALFIAAVYSASINTLFFSDVLYSYAVEGLFATGVALLAWNTMAKRSLSLWIVLTGVWAFAGAFRPTTTVFLFPLWFYAGFHVRPRWKTVLAGVPLAAAIILPWIEANQYFMAKQGFISPNFGTIEFQAMMGSTYDPASFGVVAPDAAPSGGGAYHWPFFEIAASADQALDLGLLPMKKGWPEPRIRHALRLLRFQAAKFGFYLVISAPALVALLMAIVLARGKPGRMSVDRAKLIFLGLWILPAASFYVLGHFGSFGYLQVFLSGLTLAAVQATHALATSASALARRLILISLVLCPLAGFAVFCAARPIRGRGRVAEILNLALLQYTGHAIRQGVHLTRAEMIQPSASSP